MFQLLFSILILLSLLVLPVWQKLQTDFFAEDILSNGKATNVLEFFPVGPFFAPATTTPAVSDKPVAEMPAVSKPAPLKAALRPPLGETKTAATATVAAPPPPPALSSSQIYQLIDAAVVQIICKLDNNLYVSGSGIVVSNRGVVLTNAHVVQKGTDCHVRTGNPAAYAGKFEILFVGDTATKIQDTEVPLEDFAFGRITETPANSQFSFPFKYLKLNESYAPAMRDEFFVAAYSSELIGNGGLLGSQNLVFSTTKLADYFPADRASGLIEILELTGNISTQEGASGSPVISPRDGSVIALVFGQGREGGGDAQNVSTSQRTEFAFLISYISRKIQASHGKSFSRFIEELGR